MQWQPTKMSATSFSCFPPKLKGSMYVSGKTAYLPLPKPNINTYFCFGQSVSFGEGYVNTLIQLKYMYSYSQLF